LGKIVGGRGTACIESTAFIEALRGAGPWEGISEVRGAPSPEKLGFFSEMAHFGAFRFIQEIIWKSSNILPTQLYCP